MTIWKIRKLSLKGKIVIFKTIAIPEIFLQSFITTVQKHIVNELKKIQKAFFWNNSSPVIKHETFSDDYKAERLKNVDIRNKIRALKGSWITRLYDNSFHEWKLIPLYLIEKSFGTSFKFQTKLLFKSNKIKFSHVSIGKIILNSTKPLAMMTEFVMTCIFSHCWWYNRNIQVSNASAYSLKFSKKILIMFHNFLVTMDPLNNGMNLRESMTYVKVSIFNGYN